jgi:hypothetical protein
MTPRTWVMRPMAVVALALSAASAAAGAGTPAAQQPAGVEAAKQKAKETYNAVVTAYMNSNWDAMNEAQKSASRYATYMTPQQRADLTYIRQTAGDYRPPWWKACKSTTPTKIRATIWGRGIVCNYLPADKPSISGQIDGQHTEVTVSWNPSYVDSTEQEKGRLAEEHGLTLGDQGEVIVWRQLGHSYITVSLPGATLLAMYKENQHLYQHLQSFLAELTSMYHCSPKARRTAMLIHGSTLHDPQGAAEASVRSCRAISALFLSIVLAEPGKWPSIKLPPSVPEDSIEKTVGAYVYSNVEPTWTLNEDRAFREALKEFFHANGERALKQKGKLILPNKMTFMLMEPDDRALEPKRDAWVKERLQKGAK